MAPDAGLLTEPEEDGLTYAQLRRFVDAPRRRPLLTLGTWLTVVVLSALALYVIPKRYKSSTLILVESEKVPDSFVPKVSTEDRGTRLNAIRPEILSRTRLETVFEETRPYPDMLSKVAAVEKMRRAISINVSGNDGFTIEFVHSDPRKAQEVTNRLATLFIEETIKSREEQVEGAVDFLITQVADARKALETKDEALRRYKEAHMGRLPEQLQTNLATMGMLQRELQTVEENLLFARERHEALARRAVRSSAGTLEDAGRPGTGDLAELRRQLAALRGRYTDEHPDVARLRSRVARLEARLADAAPAADGDGADPAALASREQLEKDALEVKRLEDKRTDLERRVATVRANVEETPRTEQELATLMRDYQQLNENYTALLGKQLEAQMAGRLERRWKGDRFRMLDPANLPEKPYFPKPLIVLGLGIAFGLFCGFGVAMLAEYLDPTIKDARDLQLAQGYPVLASIPHLPSAGAAGRR